MKNFKQFLSKYYDKDSEEYSDMVNINISGLLLSKRSLLGVFDNFIDGRKSQSYTQPLSVWKTDNGKLFLIDGYHRIFDFLLNGELEQNIIILGDGYTDYYAEPKDDNVFVVNVDQRFNGLENIIDINMLESII